MTMTYERAIEILDPEHREHYKSIDPVNEACRMGMEALAERAKAPQWVSVEERLPERWIDPDTSELVNYLVYSPDFGIDIGNYHAKAKRWLVIGLPVHVTHWMPLPEAPKEVSDDEGM